MRIDLVALAMGLAFALIWSSAFTSARIIVADASPLTSLTFRFLISGLIALGIALAMGQSFRLTRAQWIATIAFGICQNAVYLGFNFVAMQWVEASFAAIIASSMPLLVAAATWVVLREPLAPMGILGLLMGFAGVVLIMSARLQAGVDLTGTALCIIAVVALTIATLAMRGASSGGNLLVVIGYQMLIGAIVLAAMAAALETPYVRLSATWIIAFGYTTLFPGLLATWIWFALVSRIGAMKAATFHFLTPFFGVAVASVLLGEDLSLRDILGVAIITIGIFAVQMARVRENNPSSTSAR